MKETVDKSTFGDRLQVAWPRLFQACQGHRNKREELQVRTGWKRNAAIENNVGFEIKF